MSSNDWAVSIEALRTSIGRTTAEIEGHLTMLKELENRRHSQLRQLNTLCDPVARLPMELSSLIFLHCVPPFPEPAARDAPLLLLYICHAWSSIALSTPALWKSVRVVFPQAERFKQVFGVWLARARGLRLSISLRNDFNGDVGAIVAAHSKQIETLEVDHNGDNGAIPTRSFPPLGGISVSAGSLPSLQTLAIRGGPERRGGPYFALQILHLMRAAPALLACTLEGIYPVVGVAKFQDPLFLPALRTFEVGRHTHGTTDDDLLNALLLPGLHTLFVPLTVISVEHLVSFLERSSPPLEELGIGGMGRLRLDWSGLESCVRLLPTLTRLELRGATLDVAEGLVSALKETRDRVLPSLRTLVIRHPARISAGSPFWMTLLDVVSIRRTVLTHVEVVHLPWDTSALPRIVLDRLTQLEAEGMEVSIGSGFHTRLQWSRSYMYGI